MSLGFDVHEEERSYDQKGITDNVTRYAIKNMEFPCYIVDCSEKMIEQYKIDVLKNMFKSSIKFGDSVESDAVSIYFKQGSTTIKLGSIFSNQVKPFLQLMNGMPIVGFLDKDTILEGDYIYVLAD